MGLTGSRNFAHVPIVCTASTYTRWEDPYSADSCNEVVA